MFFNTLGFLMFIWYGAYRWTMLGTNVGKLIEEPPVTTPDITGIPILTDQTVKLSSITSTFINKIFVLNWWFAPINIITAILSIPFLTIALFTPEQYFIKYIWLTLIMYWSGIFLSLRNIYYTIEDMSDFTYMIKHPQEYSPAQIKQQFIFILIDIAMAIYVGYIVYKYKGIIG